MDGAVAAALHRNVTRAEANRSQRCRRGGFGTTLFDRCRHGASLGQVLLRKVLFRAGFLCTAARCTTLGARFSRKALRRDFASSSAWAIAEISASVRYPAAGSDWAMRGSTWVTAKLVVGALPAMRLASSMPLASPSPGATR